MANLSSSVVGQKTMALSTPVVIALDQSAIPITGTFSLTPSGTQIVTGTVVTVGGASGQGDNSLFVENVTSFVPAGGEYNASPGTLVSGSAGAVQVTKFRAMHVNLRNSSGAELTSLPVSGTVAVSNPGGGVADASVFTEGTSVYSPIGGEYTTTVTTLTSGSGGAAQVTKFRAIHVNLRDASGNEITTQTIGGTVTTVPSGTTTVVITGTDTVTGTVTIVPSGTQTSAITGNVTINAIPTGTNTIGSVTVLPSGTQTVAGTVTNVPSGTQTIAPTGTQTIAGTVTITAIPTGTNTIGSVTVLPSGTQTVAGTVTTVPPTNASENVAQFGGNNVVTGVGASGTGIPRVTVSNDSAVIVSGTTTSVPSGTTTVSVTGTAAALLATGTNTIGSVTVLPSGTQTVSGTVTVQGTVTEIPSGTQTCAPTGTTTVAQAAIFTQNLTQVGSAAFALGTASSTAAIPVVLATDQFGYNLNPIVNLFVEDRVGRQYNELQELTMLAQYYTGLDPSRGFELR